MRWRDVRGAGSAVGTTTAQADLARGCSFPDSKGPFVSVTFSKLFLMTPFKILFFL